MRINIDIDDGLMAEARAVSGFRTKREIIEEALKLMVAMKKQAGIRDMRGKLNWDGDLGDMRTDI